MNGVRYSQGLKDEAARMYVDEQVSAAVVAERLGLKTFTVKEWLSGRGLLRSMSEAAALSVAARPRARATSRLWFCSKSGERHFAESSLEFLRMQQLDDDRSVLAWARCRQPIPYTDLAGKRRNYIPDFVVTMSNGDTVIEEIKPLALVSSDLNRAKFSACRAFCRRRKWRFAVLTEKDVGYARAIAPSITTKAERRERENLLRNRRRQAETQSQREDRLAKAAKYMREFRKRRLS